MAIVYVTNNGQQVFNYNGDQNNVTFSTDAQQRLAAIDVMTTALTELKAISGAMGDKPATTTTSSSTTSGSTTSGSTTSGSGGSVTSGG